MRVRLDRITITDFKRIEELTIDLSRVTALIGSNTSGKSSALQAAQLGVSVLQAAFRKTKVNGKTEFFGTVANDAVLFRPTENLLDLRRLQPATQSLGYSINYMGADPDSNQAKSVTVSIKRGKNANIAITIDGDNDLAGILANRDHPFSILTPGLSGIPMREEWRTKGAMDAAVMHGDANLYLRTVLDHLFSRDLDEGAKAGWRERRDILALPDSGWKTFCAACPLRPYPASSTLHRTERQPPHSGDEVHRGSRLCAPLGNIGPVARVIQILAYACFYEPPLLLLDEPDAHLHADSQSRLHEALRGLAAETQTRILFAIHSPQLIQRLMYDGDATLVWMSEGAKVPVDAARRPAIPILMTLGALSAGSQVFDPARKMIVLTEDKLTDPVLCLAKASGAAKNIVALSYNGCSNLAGARLLARIIVDMRDDARVYIYRDRDFRTEEEMRFEIAIASAEHQRHGAERVVELFTPLNDAEHSFAQAEHLKDAFAGRISNEEVEAVLSDVIARKRDDLVHAARVARAQLKESLYASPRFRRKPEWSAAGMPDQEPDVKRFLPPNGLAPVAFENCHGKLLMDALRPALHHQARGATQDIGDIIYSPSRHVRVEMWAAAFA